MVKQGNYLKTVGGNFLVGPKLLVFGLDDGADTFGTAAASIFFGFWIPFLEDKSIARLAIKVG